MESRQTAEEVVEVVVDKAEDAVVPSTTDKPNKFAAGARKVFLAVIAKRFNIPNQFLDKLDSDSALHLAVVNGDLPAVKYLVSKGADVNHRTTKNLFEKESHSSTPMMESKHASSKYKVFGYYGEYPLSIAAVFNHTQIYDFLIQSGADTDAQDSFGNTVLHVIVIHNQIDMFSYSMRHPWKRANPWTKNNDKLTPIALCCQLGYSKMFDEIMELSKVETQRYSDLEDSLYPMASFDTIGPNGVTDHQSAMMMLVFGEETGHLEMLHHEVVQKILAEKWRVFVKGRFKSRLLLTVLHSIFLSVAVYLRPKGRSIGYVDYRDGLRYFSECVICFIGTPCTFLFHIEEIKTSGMITFLVSLKNSPSKAVFLMSCTLCVICVNIRFAMLLHPNNDHSKLLVAEEACASLVAPTAWVWFLFFLKTHNSFGPLIITLYTMIAKDVTKVMVIFAVFWVMFAVAFFYLWNGSIIESLDSIEESVMTVFHMSFGTFEMYKYFEESKFPALAAICFFLMMLLMPILLLNMLIATMGNTFNRVIYRSQQEWFSQYAKTVITLERAFPKKKLCEFQKKYTTELTKETFDCRYKKGKNRGYLQDMSSDWICAGLLVRKKVPHTRAFVQKRSYKNWKWLYGILRTVLKARRWQLKKPAQERVTYWDLFGTDDILDSKYLKEKMISENLRNISLTHLFTRSFDAEGIAEVAKRALSAKAPKITPAKTGKTDSIDDLLNGAE